LRIVLVATDASDSHLETGPAAPARSNHGTEAGLLAPEKWHPARERIWTPSIPWMLAAVPVSRRQPGGLQWISMSNWCGRRPADLLKGNELFETVRVRGLMFVHSEVKLHGDALRDEEVVGSNPATPTRKSRSEA